MISLKMVAAGSIVYFVLLVVSIVGMISSTIMSVVVVEKNGIKPRTPSDLGHPDRGLFDAAEITGWVSFSLLVLMSLVLYFISPIGKSDLSNIGRGIRGGFAARPKAE